MSATHDTYNWEYAANTHNADLDRRSRECRERAEALERFIRADFKHSNKARANLRVGGTIGTMVDMD